MELGVVSEYLTSFPISKKYPPSTDAEAVGIVEFAREHGWQSLIVTVPPLHQARAFISTISAVLKANSPLKVYSLPGAPLRWTEEVLHSQSAPRARRCDQFEGELSKLIRYRDKGDHVPIETILEYLNRRDES